MALFKCKMCGGNLEILDNQSIAQCESCGTDQTLPRLNDDKIVNLYERANHLRRNNEYDKAERIYEKILNEDPTDAEAYWSLVLCQYGIEYVEEPRTYRRIPTVNRAQYTSIYADENFKAALTYSDPHQKGIYEKESEVIDEIQKGILKVSKDEEPFDVFISYKESDDNKSRTPDSVLANELYHQLTNEGFKVFFSRITLENKLGTAYEPYIFSALNSAKVMVVIGTKEDYFNAVWVRNEWGRYLSLIRQGEDKVLIPAYRDMDPYDLPEEFSHLQAQDMSALGFMQDLIRGIKKIIQKEESTPTHQMSFMNEQSSSIKPLIKRAFILVEDGEFTRADEVAEQILNLNPEEPNAYLIKLMIDCEVHIVEDFANVDDVEKLEENNHFKRMIRYGSDELKDQFDTYIKETNKRLFEQKKESIYNEATELIASNKIKNIVNGIKKFKIIEKRNYKDSHLKIEEGKANIYEKAVVLSESEQLSALRRSLEYFDLIPDFRDVHVKVEETNDKIQRIKDDLAEQERKEEERKESIYQQAMEKYNSNDVYVIIEGKKEFHSIKGYKKASQMVLNANDKVYESALKLAKSRRTSKLKKAIDQFNLLDGYQNSKAEIRQSQNKIAKNKKIKLNIGLLLILFLNFLIFMVLLGLGANRNLEVWSIIIMLIILYQTFIAKPREWNSILTMIIAIVLLYIFPTFAIPIMTIIVSVKLVKTMFK